MISQHNIQPLLPTCLTFQNEMTLNLAGFETFLSVFQMLYLENKSLFPHEKTFNEKTPYLQDLTKAIVQTHNDKEFFIQLGVNTESIVFYHGVDTLTLEEEHEGAAAEYLSNLPVDPMKKVAIPIAPLLKMMKYIQMEDLAPLDFENVEIIRIRDYYNDQELVLSIDDVIQGISE